LVVAKESRVIIYFYSIFVKNLKNNRGVVPQFAGYLHEDYNL